MKRKGITLIIIFTMLFSIHTIVFADNEFNFSDLKSHWSVEYVEELYSKGIISGYPDGTFLPNNNVSRAEAIKMLTVATGEDVGSNKDGYWADNYIRQAISIGYVLESEFDDYNKPMSRLELAKIIVRAIDEEYISDMNEYSKQITDYDTIDDKDKEYVLKAFVKGIITGYPDGAFKSDNNVTRTEASTMLVRLLNPDKRKIPEVKKGDDTFIEPELEVFYYTSKYGSLYHAINVKNHLDYVGKTEHIFTTECVSHPQINTTIFKKMGSDTEYLPHTSDEIEMNKTNSKSFDVQPYVYTLYNRDRWKPSKGSFDIKDGDIMKYKVTVTNSITTKEYYIEFPFKDREFTK
ncbi:S-layer homology domain-containing protein [Proteiniborus sp. MB09-C3]|uniref:S-layer homology domain-containing protein n=1 Tax=Proteiniborus sp. MB09-C3 TaxID=3050072 RepID=UPI0025545060|nr:S-layer homology domain-containing protein [Proteiniborus sp. MB09-C3]WIV11128.1 S-layer homology domain-containing protein [Proteiniborus sp. MB09-C3]